VRTSLFTAESSSTVCVAKYHIQLLRFGAGLEPGVPVSLFRYLPATTLPPAVVGSASQALANPNPSTYLGSGKLASVATQVRELAVDTVIIDDEISPGQQRNLEKALGSGVRVADRTALILDIFAQRARTKEGKLQVL
jgi:hypothetical protein